MMFVNDTTTSSASHVISIVLWYFLPPFLSSYLLKSFYHFYPELRPTVTVNSPPSIVKFQNARAQSHSNNARIFLVSCYLLYTLLSTYFLQSTKASQNLYSVIGLPRHVVEAEGVGAIKSHWRRLARVYHPDKIGKAGEPYFITLRSAVETLEDDTKRWAYERFGAESTTWDKLIAKKEYLVRGVTMSATFYAVTVTSVMGLSVVQKHEGSVQFWRFISLLALIVGEATLLVSPGPTRLFSFFLPRRLIYQHILFLRQLFISTSFALAQLLPLVFPVDSSEVNAMPNEEYVRAREKMVKEVAELTPLLERIGEVTRNGDAEMRRLQGTEYRPLMIERASLYPLFEKRVAREGEEEVEEEAGMKEEREKMNLEIIKMNESLTERNVEVDKWNDLKAEELKARMVESYGDFMFKMTDEGQAIWNRITLEDLQKKGLIPGGPTAEVEGAEAK